MSLAVADTGFESLKGTMITPAGWEGIDYFRENLPDYHVVDDAFTNECEDMLFRQGTGWWLNMADLSPEAVLLVDFLGSLCADSFEPRKQANVTWRHGVTGVTRHVDFKSGHTAIGNFQVKEDAYMEFHCTRATEPKRWIFEDEFEGSYDVPILKETQGTIAPIRNRQLTLINGEAVQATRKVDGSQQPASVPHRVIAEGRSRLMVFAL